MGEHLNPKRAADLRRLSRTEVKTLTDVFTGHGNLAYHRHKIGLAESPLRRLCIYILSDCPAIRDKRQILTGCFSTDVAVIQTKSVAQVLPFRMCCGVAHEVLVGDATGILKHQGPFRVPAIDINTKILIILTSKENYKFLNFYYIAEHSKMFWK